MKRILSILVFLNISLFAAGNVAATLVEQYKVTINKLEIYNSSTSSWVTLANTSTVVDIASATAGADIASMISSDAQIPFGTYTQARVSIGNQFPIKACGSAGDDCTTGATVYNNPHYIAVAGDGNAVASEATLVIDFNDPNMAATMTAANATALTAGCMMVYTLSSPLVIDDTTESMSATISFDLDNILDFNDGGNYIVVDFPSVSVSMQ